MKKVRYTNIDDLFYGQLVVGDVYDVFRYIPSKIDKEYDKIELKSIGIFRLYFNGRCFFKDVTTELRNDVINEILE